ncbi:MAG: prepilin-type N-terminal cleavage/methylation domain-containing protein, partial [Pseudomonadota bacterium]
MAQALSSGRAASQQGMTLLEVLVVLVIIGIVAATVSPPMARIVESVRFKTTADGVAEQIRALRIAALLEQQDLTLRAQTEETIQNQRRDAGRSGPVGDPDAGLALALG